VNFLEELRKHSGLTQQALADQSGVGKSTIVKIEAGTFNQHVHVTQALQRPDEAS
jgi:DNA-binding XRE family transcriptional regulator